MYELYALPGHSSRCNRKETEIDAQGAASATTRKKHKQRQKWMNNSNKEMAIRILTRLNTLIALERKERRRRYGVHLPYSRSATSNVKNNSLHDSAGSTTFLPCLPEHVVAWRSVFDYTSPVREKYEAAIGYLFMGRHKKHAAQHPYAQSTWAF